MEPAGGYAGSLREPCGLSQGLDSQSSSFSGESQGAAEPKGRFHSSLHAEDDAGAKHHPRDACV